MTTPRKKPNTTDNGPYKEMRLEYEHLTSPVAKAFAGDIAAYIEGKTFLEHRSEARKKNRQRTISHEIGHAILLSASGCVVEKVVVSMRDAFAGCLVTSRPFVDFSDVSATVNYLVLIASGYVGESVISPNKVAAMGASHELGVVIYLSQFIEVHHGIPALNTMRAVLAVCEEAIALNSETVRTLTDAFKTRDCLEVCDLSEILAGVKHIDPYNRWLDLLQQGKKPTAGHAALEQFLIFGWNVARAAQQTYVAHYGEGAA